VAVAKSLGSAVFWAATWGVGVAIGVALGGWLTVVGGAGTPGVESLDIIEDVLLLPGIVGFVVFCVHLVGQGLVGIIRRDRAPGDSDDDQEKHEDTQ